MCETAFATTTPALTLEPPPPSLFSRLGSRRRRLWELSRESHCPVIGVCLPLPLLRKLVGKALSQTAPLGDYDLHVGAVSLLGQGGGGAEQRRDGGGRQKAEQGSTHRGEDRFLIIRMRRNTPAARV